MNISGKRTLAMTFIVLAAIAMITSVSARTSTAHAQGVSGTWQLTVETQGGTGNPSVTLKQEGEEITGTYKGRFGDAPLKGTIKGNEIQFTISINAQGQDLKIEYSGAVDGSTMKGKVKFGEMAEGTFTGKKE